jgi:hypothetical protein
MFHLTPWLPIVCWRSLLRNNLSLLIKLRSRHNRRSCSGERTTGRNRGDCGWFGLNCQVGNLGVIRVGRVVVVRFVGRCTGNLPDGLTGRCPGFETGRPTGRCTGFPVIGR